MNDLIILLLCHLVGDYVLQSGDGGALLAANPYRTPQPHFNTVALKHLPGHNARHYALASGDIHYYYNDLADGDLPGIVGANRAVRMNAMVYMGVNGARPALAKNTVRQALSLLLDRTAVCTTAYASWATPSASTFHPDWGSNTAEDAVPTRDIGGATALLDAAGYTPKNGKRLTLELIYSTERTDRARVADLVRTQMEGGGVAITPVPLTEEEYRKFVADFPRIAENVIDELSAKIMTGDSRYMSGHIGHLYIFARNYKDKDAIKPFDPSCDGMGNLNAKALALSRKLDPEAPKRKA